MNILLVDDHIMTLEGYSASLNKEDCIFKAQNCKQVYEYVSKRNVFDVAVIDYGLPPFPEQNLENGGDCVLFIKKNIPDCRIILITAYSEIIELYSMYKKVEPHGLIVKEDLTMEDFKSVVYDPDYFIYLSDRAKYAVNLMKTKVSLLNETNIEILMYLSKGFKVNELAEVIGLSKSAIQKRIAKMQLEFNVSDTSGLIKVMYELDYF